jgi:uncharacterized protein YbjT (DUF2867 family)
MAETAIAVVAGATGLVGRELVRQLAADGGWREVRALVRRALPDDLRRPTVRPIQINYDELGSSAEWAQADHVFCALGTTMRQAGSQEAFRRVDFEYPLALARVTLGLGARHFLLVTAVGANTGSRAFYNRVKGELEEAVIGLGFRSVTIARPSVILGDRQERRPWEQVGRVLGLVAPPSWRPVEARAVAQALVVAAKQDRPGVQILKNPALRAATAP